MTSLIELAERVEAATGPDRGLDWLTWQTGDPQRANEVFWAHRSCVNRDFEDDRKNEIAKARAITAAPAYSASIDAAMSLVPEGCWGAFDPHFMDEERVVKFRGYIFWPDWTRWTPHGDWIDRSEGNPLCATPALAVLAAALRARASL